MRIPEEVFVMAVRIKGKGLPKISIAGAGLAVPPKKAIRLRYSNYTFMFNTNYRPKTTSEAETMSDQMEAACTKTFSTENLKKWVRYVDYDAATKAVSERDGSWSEIKGVKVRYQVEIGPNLRYGGRMHVHGTVQFTHTGAIRLDYAAANEAAKDYLTDEGCAHTFANMRWSTEKITQKQYMHKYEEEEEEELPLKFGKQLRIE